MLIIFYIFKALLSLKVFKFYQVQNIRLSEATKCGIYQLQMSVYQVPGIDLLRLYFPLTLFIEKRYYKNKRK